MKRLARTILVCTIASVAATRTAHAQTAAQREEARQHFARGMELIAIERWQEAIPEMEAARDIAATPAVLFNLGLAQRAVGQIRSSLVTFREFLTLSGSTISPERHAQTTQYISELRAALGHLTVHVDPASAELSVDGVPAHELATPDEAGVIELDPGRHVVVARSVGSRPASRTVNLANGARETLDLRLVALTTGRLRIDCDPPRAVLRIDGRDGHLCNSTLELDAGRHSIDVRAPVHEPFHQEVTVAPGSAAQIRVQLAPVTRVLGNPWVWGGASLLVVAIVGLVIYELSGTYIAEQPPGGIIVSGIGER